MHLPWKKRRRTLWKAFCHICGSASEEESQHWALQPPRRKQRSTHGASFAFSSLLSYTSNSILIMLCPHFFCKQVRRQLPLCQMWGKSFPMLNLGGGGGGWWIQCPKDGREGERHCRESFSDIVGGKYSCQSWTGGMTIGHYLPRRCWGAGRRNKQCRDQESPYRWRPRGRRTCKTSALSGYSRGTSLTKIMGEEQFEVVRDTNEEHPATPMTMAIMPTLSHLEAGHVRNAYTTLGLLLHPDNMPD